MNSSYASGSAIGLMALLSVAHGAASPAQASPLTDALAGEWSGSGRLTLASGVTERIRCHGTARSVTASRLEQFFDCASTGKNFTFSSSIFFDGDRLSGSWSGPGRSGSLTGTATRSSVRANLSSPAGEGNLTTRISGCSQTLQVTGWAEEMKSLSVQLKKDC